MSPTEVMVAVLIAVGIVGIVVPVLPGSILVLGAILVWATEVGTRAPGSSSRWPRPSWSPAPS